MNSKLLDLQITLEKCTEAMKAVAAVCVFTLVQSLKDAHNFLYDISLSSDKLFTFRPTKIL